MRKNRLKLRTGEKVGHWKLSSKLGEGGNGQVWRAISEEREVAIKVLTTKDDVSRKRFTNEIQIVKEKSTTGGIIPIFDHCDLFESGDQPIWYTMPVAEPMESLTHRRPIEQIVRYFVELAETISALHEAHICHRDIKPENILTLNNRLCLSDFGLAKTPSRIELTPQRRDVGAKYTMAPEMRRNAKDADGRAADVYSYSKTLWIALTGNKLSYDGQYSTNSSMALNKYISGKYLTPIDEVMRECTDNIPDNRPSMHSVRSRLLSWLETINSFEEVNGRQWTEFLDRVFPHGTPKRAVWTDTDAIIKILNEIGQFQALNHMFYPDGGGNNITGARRACEEGLIEIGTSVPVLMLPLKLTFENCGGMPEWNYMRLEASPIAPVANTHMSLRRYGQLLTEIMPGEYCAPDVFFDNGKNSPPPPEVSRLVKRFTEGAFVFFCTSSRYNHDTSTYDARHQKMGELGFLSYVQACCRDKKLNSRPLGSRLPQPYIAPPHAASSTASSPLAGT